MDAHGVVLPQALLRALPSDPADVLAVSHQIAAFAFATKAAQGDAEVGQVRALLTQRQSELRALERRCDELEAELAHARAEARRSAAECEKVVAEKDTLLNSVKQLNKEVFKLEAFKRNVLKTLNDEAVETVDHSHSHSAYSPAPELPSAVKAFQQGGAALSSVRADAAAGQAPDGRDFFKAARARLPPDVFTEFLNSIKALNAHTRTRTQTLADAAVLFGAHNDDLYRDFEALLAAHLA